MKLHWAQEKGNRLKATAKYEKKIKELSEQCQRKTDECYQAWMSLTVANEELSKVRLELETTSFQTVSLGRLNDPCAVNLLCDLLRLNN